MDSGSEIGVVEGQAEKIQQRLTPQINAAIIPALFHAEFLEKKLARKVVLLQCGIVLAAAGSTWLWGSSPQYAMAVMSGGAVSILNGGMLAWRMHRAAMHHASDAHQQLRLIYFYAVERFLAVVVALGICMVALELHPLVVLGGFVLGQVVLLLARLLMRLKN